MSNDKKTFFDKLPEAVKAELKKVADKLKEFKAEFSEVPATPVTPATPTQMATNDGQLQDGTAFKYTGDKLDVGSEVTIVDANGELPMPEGEYIAADGATFTVTADPATGKSVVSAMTPVTEEGMKADTEKKVSERITKIVEKFDAQFKAIETENSTLKTEIENLKLKVSKQATMIAESTELVVAMGSIETAEAIEPPVLSSKESKLANLKIALDRTVKK